jgi:glycosyltransferase involved in cell wall biosynthesis
LRQSERDWECVLVDDGSRDTSLEIALAAAQTDARIRVHSRDHRGLVSALNHGLEHCRGRYVARMDADDWMTRERLARQAAALDATPDWSGVGCHVRVFPRRTLAAGMREYERWLNAIESAEHVRTEALVECPLAHPTWMLRRDALTALGYRDVGWPEDYELLLRAMREAHTFGVVPRRLLAWRNRPTRLSRTHDAYMNDRFVACKAEHIAKTLLADGDRYVLWGYGGTGRSLQRALLDHGKRPAAILELHPGRIGNTIAGAPVLHPDVWLSDPRHPLVVSVAGTKARTQIRAALSAAGLTETVDFVCAA